MHTIEEAKKFVDDGISKGVICPCCDQLCKLYKRDLLAGMVIDLISVYKIQMQTGKVFIHAYDDAKIHGGDYAKLRYWGLLKPKGDEPEDDKKTSGFWSITQKGKDFVLGKIRVPSYVLVYNNKKRGEAETTTDIQTALGKKFSWTELMGGFLQDTGKQSQQLPRPVGGVSFTALGEGRYECVGANGKKYSVQHNNGFWNCGCEAYRFSAKKLCKHISMIVKYIDDRAKAQSEKHQQKIF